MIRSVLARLRAWSVAGRTLDAEAIAWNADMAMWPETLRLLGLHEERLIALGVHDNQRITDVWIHLYADGSGMLMCEYCTAKPGDTKEAAIVQLLLAHKTVALVEFDSVRELYDWLRASEAARA